MPLSTNKMYVGRKILTHLARENKALMKEEAFFLYEGKLFEKPISVVVHFYYPDRRSNDIDNKKLLFDALTGIVWKDDRLIDEDHAYRHFGYPEPRVEIEVSEL